jgi:hypothetical protein
MMATYKTSEVRQLVPWIESLDEVSPHVAGESAEQLGSTLFTRESPNWRSTTVYVHSDDLVSQCCTSPMSPLSAESQALGSSTCGPRNHQERTKEVANSSEPFHYDIEHESITPVTKPALDGREASEDQS